MSNITPVLGALCETAGYTEIAYTQMLALP